MKENLEVAANAEGSLQEQADIYAESWEAARKRVQTALQGIYSQLIDDNFFIKMTDGVAVFVEAIGTVIDKMGGLKGVLMAIGGVVTSVYAKELPKAFENLKQNLMVFTGAATKAMSQVQKENEENLNKIISDPKSSTETSTRAQGLLTVQNMQEKLIASNNKLSESEKEAYKNRIKNVEAMNAETTALAKKIDEQEAEIALLTKETKQQAQQYVRQTYSGLQDEATSARQKADALKHDYNSAKAQAYGAGTLKTPEKQEELSNLQAEMDAAEEKATELENKLKELNDAFGLTGEETAGQRIGQVNAAIDALISEYTELNQQITQYNSLADSSASQTAAWKKEASEIKVGTDAYNERIQKMRDWLGTVKEVYGSTKGIPQRINTITKLLDDGSTDFSKIADKAEELTKKIEALKNEKLDGSENTEGLYEKLNEIQKKFDSLHVKPEILNKLKSDLELTEEEAQELKNALDNINAQSHRPLEGGDASKKLTQYVQLGSALMSVYSAMSSLVSLGSTLKDVITGDASAMEMFGSVASAVMTVTMALNTVSQATLLLKATENGLTAIQNVLTEKHTENLIAQTVAQKIANVVAEKGIALNIAALGLLGLVVLAIGAVVVVVKKLYQAWKDNTIEARLEAINTEVETLTTALNDATQAAEDFKSAVDEWDEAVSAIDEMTQGTQEYKDAIEDANEKAKELIETYGLYGDWHYDDSGLITFDKGSLQEAYDAKEKTANNLQTATDAAQYKQAQLTKENYISNFSGSDYDTEDRIEDLRTIGTLTAMGASSGVAVGATFAGIGAVPGLAAGAALGAGAGISNLVTNRVSNSISEKEAKQVASYIQDMTDGQIANAKASFEETGSIDVDAVNDGLDDTAVGLHVTAEQAEQLTTAFKNAGSTLDETISAIRSSDKEDYYAQQTVTDYLEAKGKYSGDSQKQTAYANLLSQNLDVLNKISETTEKPDEGYKKALSKAGYKTDEEQARAYAEKVLGWSEEKAMSATYADKKLVSGEDTVDISEIGKDVVQKALYTAVQSENLDFSEQEKSIDDLFDTIDKNFESSANVLYDALQTYSSEDGFTFDLEDISPEQKEELLTNAKSLGEKYAAAVEEGLANWNEQDYWDAREEEQKTNQESLISSEGLDTDAIKLQTALLQESTEALEDNENAARQLAINNTLMNQGLDTLIDNWSNWKKVLQSSDKTTAEYAETVSSLLSVMSDLTGLSDDLVKNLSADFFDDANIQSLLNKAATKADTDAIEQLGMEAAKDVVNNLDAVITEAYDEDTGELLTDKVMIGGDIFDTSALDQFDSSFSTLKSKVVGYMSDIQSAVSAGSLSIGDSISNALSDGDIADFVTSLNDMARYTQMSVADMNSLLSSMGMEANVTVQDVDVQSLVPQYETTITNTSGKSIADLITDNTGTPIKYTSVTKEIKSVPMTETKQVASISYDGSNPKASINYIGHGSSSQANKTAAKKANSGSSSSKSTEQHQKTELDAYHDVNRAISNVTDEMDKLDKAKEHLAGNQLVDALRLENEQLEKQKKNYEDLSTVINSEAGRLQKLLSVYGVEFDETTGEMTNYVESYNKALADYNAAIDKYNASSQEQSDKDALEKAKTAYSDFKDYVDEYDETLDKWLENEQNKLEAYYQQIENNYEAWETKIELSLDLASAQQDWNKFWQKVNKDIKSAYTDYAKEFSDLTTNFNTYRDTTLATDLQVVKDIKSELDILQAGGESSMYASASEAANDLLEKTNTLRDDAESLYDMYNEAWDDYLESIDQATEKWSDLLDKFDNINEELEHYSQIIDLIYGGSDTVAGRNYYDQLYQAQADTSLAKQNALAEEIASLEKERKELLAAGAKETDSDVKALQEAIEEANSTLSSEIESYLQTIQSKLTNAIQSIMDTADKALTQNVTGDTLAERWEKSQDAAEGYYDEVQRVFEIQSMADKWQDLINSTSTIKNQQYLKTIMDSQLQNLKDKTKLSEYDIELAEKELAIYQAQIALEDAQNNKSTMKLTRDDAGNWTYNYVADEDDVAEKQEDLLTALQEKYNYIKTSSEEATQSLLELYNTAQEELTTLLEEYQTADETRRAEIQEQYDYLYNYYFGEEGLIVQKAAETTSMQTDLNTAAMESLWALYETDQENYQIMTENEQALVDELRDNSIESLRELLETVATDDGSFYNQMQEKCSEVCAESKTQWQLLAEDVIANWATNPGSVQNTITEAYNQIMNKVAEYDNAIAQSEQVSGVAWTNVSNYISATASTISSVVSMVDSVITETDKLSESRKAVENLRQEWYAVAQQIQQVAEMIASVNDTSYSGPKASYVSPTLSDYTSPSTASSGSGGSGSGSSGSSSGSGNSGNTNSDSKKTTQIFYNKSYSEDGALRAKQWAASKTGTASSEWSIVKSGNKYYLRHDGSVVNPDLLASYSTTSATSSSSTGSAVDLSWDNMKKYFTSSFDTGGYTGDWNGGEGKMAMLHSKELVLNKDDTENMLSAVSAVREISSLGSSITSSIASGIGNMIKSLLNLKSPSDVSTNNISKSNEQTNNNTFEITMNVDGGDVEEIKTAILSLPNLASQYLSQK